MNPARGPGSGKLVRDKIPQLIRSTGAEPSIRVARPAEYSRLLRDKLTEEVREFLDSGDDLSELADIVEVVLALACDLGYSPDHLEELRIRKAAERGSFTSKYIWCGNAPRQSRGCP